MSSISLKIIGTGINPGDTVNINSNPGGRTVASIPYSELPEYIDVGPADEVRLMLLDQSTRKIKAQSGTHTNRWFRVQDGQKYVWVTNAGIVAPVMAALAVAAVAAFLVLKKGGRKLF